jgi:hypothetical protein
MVALAIDQMIMRSYLTLWRLRETGSSGAATAATHASRQGCGWSCHSRLPVLCGVDGVLGFNVHLWLKHGPASRCLQRRFHSHRYM